MVDYGFSMDGLYRFEPPRTFPACEAVTLGDAMDGCLSDPKKISTELRANRGHASAQQFRRVLAEPDGGNTHLAILVGEVLGQREMRRAFDRASHAL